MKNEYFPDNWVVVKFLDHYRILAGWSGDYVTPDSWRMNSGITKVEQDPDVKDYLIFYGSSGSAYFCQKDTYCLRMNNAYVWSQLQEKYGDKVNIMPENTDWFSVDWLI